MERPQRWRDILAASGYYIHRLFFIYMCSIEWFVYILLWYCIMQSMKLNGDLKQILIVENDGIKKMI